MRLVSKALFLFLCSLFFLGSVFGVWGYRHELTSTVFYIITLVSSMISVWGFIKANKLIFFIFLPAILRVGMYLFGNDLSILGLFFHLLGLFIPVFISFKVYEIQCAENTIQMESRGFSKSNLKVALVGLLAAPIIGVIIYTFCLYLFNTRYS